MQLTFYLSTDCLMMSLPVLGALPGCVSTGYIREQQLWLMTLELFFFCLVPCLCSGYTLHKLVDQILLVGIISDHHGFDCTIW